MNYLYENTDNLHTPVEAFTCDACKMAFPVESHWHYFVEILYILEGTAWVTCNQRTYILNSGEMIFLPPQAVHAIYTTTPQPLRYTVLKFDSNRMNLSADYLPKISFIFRTALREERLPITFAQKDFEDFSLTYFFEQCVKECEQKQYGYDSYLTSNICLLIIKMLRLWRNSGYYPDDEAIEKDEDYSIHDILMYIDEHSHEKLVVEKLAEMCHMSYSYFAKTFHKLYGQSCKEYIEFIRLNKAENLLLFTNEDLNYISTETGFSDCSHLIRVFKRKYGVTPKQYRMKYSGR